MNIKVTLSDDGYLDFCNGNGVFYYIEAIHESLTYLSTKTWFSEEIKKRCVWLVLKNNYKKQTPSRGMKF